MFVSHLMSSASPEESPPSSAPMESGPYSSQPPRPLLERGEPRSTISELRGLIRTIRPHQWIKNIFVLAPVVFATKLFDPVMLSNALVAFVAFCLLAGAVYTFNDLTDVVADRQHPVKRQRPIASGRVREAVARAFAIALVVVSLGAALWVSPWFAAIAVGYFLLNIAYTLHLKNVAYVDVGCIALGFVLRVLGGGAATRIEVSWYLFACTALLALFLGFGKRRHELTTAAARRGQQRAALETYTKRGLDAALIATASATVLTYLIYTLDPSTRAFFRAGVLWPTTLFVILGVARFIHIVRFRPKAESPTQEMLSDGPMVAIVLLWIMVVMWFVYNLHPG